MQQTNPRILGIGSYVPPRIVTNFDLEPLLDTKDEWIRQRTGVMQRRYVEPSVATSDLAAAACGEALSQARLTAADIDLVLCATVTPDHEFPGTACFLQAKLGIPAGAIALDLRQQCSGFVFGLSIANQYLSSGAAKHVLLVGAEVHSKCMDMSPRGRDVSVLFGDGAGALVLGGQGAQGPEISAISIGCDGTHARDLWCPAPGTGLGTPSRLLPFMLDEGMHYPKMNGRSVFVNAVRTMSDQLTRATTRVGATVNDVDCFIIHQANRRIAEAIADNLKVPSSRFHDSIHKFGNTTAASIPLGLADAVAAGAIKPGMLVAIAAFGSGYAYGSAIVHW